MPLPDPAPPAAADGGTDPHASGRRTRRRWMAGSVAAAGLAVAAVVTAQRAPSQSATQPVSLPAEQDRAHAFDPARLDAARLLSQATWGPTVAEIERVAALGPQAWLREQFAAASMDTHWDYVVVRKGPIGCNPCTAQHINAVMESFWTQAVRGPDQLRQRMVLALAEIFVTSAVNSPIEIHEPAHASWLDLLATHAFGNFRTLLEQVSIHPAMAHYLSHMRNEKEDPATGRIPDENYAREVMQLFTIGLWELHEDGTRRQDARGRDIPTYGQADVMGLAKVFTGWSWNGPDTGDGRWHGWDGIDWKRPLQNYARFHSTSEKRFLGTVIPRGTPGPESLRRACERDVKERDHATSRRRGPTDVAAGPAARVWGRTSGPGCRCPGRDHSGLDCRSQAPATHPDCLAHPLHPRTAFRSYRSLRKRPMNAVAAYLSPVRQEA